MSHVKPRRRYDSSRRQEDARRNRQAVLEVAERRFLADGYPSTTVAAVAEEAGVSPELVYKAYGGKGGLVQAIYERRLGGTGQVPAYQRSDQMREKHQDPRLIMHEWGLLTAEVAATLTPVRLLVRAAATTDPDMATLLERIEEERLDRMRHHAEFLAERGYLRSGVSTGEATDILWACSSTEFYELLVLQRKWSLPRFAQFITDFMTTGLLPRG
jgi:AcrR family transcriptional regulator